MIRLLLGVLVVASLGWSGYWWVGATAKKTAIQAWLDRPEATAADVRVTGFPNRFDTVMTDLALVDPQTGWRWSTPSLRIYALSYQPNKVIATLAPRQTLDGMGQSLSIASDRMAASLHLFAGPALALRETIVETRALRVTSDQGWAVGLSSGQLALRAVPAPDAPENSYEIDVRAADLTLPEPVRRQLDPTAALPATIGPVHARATPVLDKPLDRHAGDGAPPALRSIDIDRVALTWGPLTITASGALIADSLGRADGSLSVEAENWPAMLVLAENAGAIGAAEAQTLRRALTAAALTTGDAARLKIRLNFSGGRTRLGPIPIGPAPQIRYLQ